MNFRGFFASSSEIKFIEAYRGRFPHILLATSSIIGYFDDWFGKRPLRHKHPRRRQSLVVWAVDEGGEEERPH